MLEDKAREAHLKDSVRVLVCQSFNKYLLSTNYMPETMLNSRPTRAIKTKSSQGGTTVQKNYSSGGYLLEWGQTKSAMVTQRDETQFKMGSPGTVSQLRL